jgi:hypothetical protein
MTAIEIFACRVFDQDGNEVAYRPTIEDVVAPIHDGLQGLDRELRELLQQADGPAYRLGFATGLAAAVSAGSRTHKNSTHLVVGCVHCVALPGPMTR